MSLVSISLCDFISNLVGWIKWSNNNYYHNVFRVCFSVRGEHDNVGTTRAIAISDCYDVMLYVNVGKLLHSENEKK